MKEIRVAILGNVDSAKSTLVSTITYNILDNGRKWTRNNEIFKENGDLSATVISNGAFFSRETRKVITPPEEIFKKIFINE